MPAFPSLALVDDDFSATAKPHLQALVPTLLASSCKVQVAAYHCRAHGNGSRIKGRCSGLMSLRHALLAVGRKVRPRRSRTTVQLPRCTIDANIRSDTIQYSVRSRPVVMPRNETYRVGCIWRLPPTQACNLRPRHIQPAAPDERHRDPAQ